MFFRAPGFELCSLNGAGHFPSSPPFLNSQRNRQKNTRTWLQQCLVCIPGLHLEFGLFPRYFKHIWISVVIAWLELTLKYLQTDNLDTRPFCFSTCLASLCSACMHGRHALPLWLALIMMNFKFKPLPEPDPFVPPFVHLHSKQYIIIERLACFVFK